MDPHVALENDVALLREILTQVLKRDRGQQFLELTQKVMQLSKNTRQGDEKDLAHLQDFLKTLSSEETQSIARAGGIFLTLANFAENHHRLRRRRSYELDPRTKAQPGSSEAVINNLIQSGFSKDQVFSCVSKMRIDLVLTAHPTEALLPTLQQKYQRIASALFEKDRPNLTPQEKKEVENILLFEITAIWLTPDVRQSRPTPLEEARSGLAVIEQVLWDSIPRFMRALDESLFLHTDRHLPLQNTPIRFDTWMGGDRDGNPAVTADITKQVVNLSRWRGAILYKRELDLLIDDLTFTKISAELRSFIGNSSEPYKSFLAPIREKFRSIILNHQNFDHDILEKSPTIKIDDTITKNQFLEALMICRRSLCETGAEVIASRRLDDLIRRLNVFGLGLVRLDIRQEAARHSALISSICREIGCNDYASKSEYERQRFLIDQLNTELELPTFTSLNAEDQEVLDTFIALTLIPRDSLGSYIISMARSPSDILAVEYLQKLAGLRNPLPVVPLFEQVEDLRLASETIDQLFSLPWYINHISHAGFTPKQQIMIGYSDSAKAAGRLSAAWELYQAQESLKKICDRHGVSPTIFHGRGGTISRGGGPTYMAIAAQPPGLVQNSMRVTEQGETILEKFGSPGLAIRNLELYTSAVLEATIRPATDPKDEWRIEMCELATKSEKSFRTLVESNPNFISYFMSATPAPELSLLNIGSRPARRSSSEGLKSLRAIPWSFAWTQTRLHLPAWLGVDSALKEAIENGRMHKLNEMYRDWPFFRTTLDLIEMVLAKSDSSIAAFYDRVLVSEDLHHLGESLRIRLQETMSMILLVSKHDHLLEENHTLKRLIATRNPYVDPINFLQAVLLKQYRQKPTAEHAKSQRVEYDSLTVALLSTINAIAAGMRNTG